MIRSIEGLRGIAALLVVFFHSYGNHWHGFVGDLGIVKHAFLFVDMFFVISGFVMASVYGESLRSGASLKAYVVRRFFRLYPLHIVMTFAVPAMYAAVQLLKLIALKAGHPIGDEEPFSRTIIDPLFLLTEIFLLNGIGIHRLEIGNFPSWSVSVEFWMYIAFALLFFLVRRRGARIALSAGIVLASMAHFLWMWHQPDVATRDLIVIGLPRGFMSFFMGVLVAHLWLPHLGKGVVVKEVAEQAQVPPSSVDTSDGVVAPRTSETTPGGARVYHDIPQEGRMHRWSDVTLGAAQFVAAAIVFSLIWNQPLLLDWQLLLPLSFALLVYLLLPDRGLVARALMTRPIQWLGKLSYSVYLVHIFVLTPIDVFGRAWPDPKRHIVGVVLVGGVLLLSMLTYRYIEVPWRARGKRIADRIEGKASRPRAMRG